MVGKVVKGIGGFYFVNDGKEVYRGKARGNLKRNKEVIYVGDLVDFELDNNFECIINRIIERKNFLTRPPVSNLEMLVVVFAAANPDVNFPVIDKLIAACEAKGIELAVCISKKDLVSENILKSYMDIYSDSYPVVAVNGNTAEGIDELFNIIKGKNVALAGSSGVGKSTITNALIGSESAETGEISSKTSRGRHTTRHVEVFALAEDTFLYDTPGFTSLELTGLEIMDIQTLFPEFRKHRGECRYADCVHINEPECIIKQSVADGSIKKSRYDSYLIMIEEVKKWHR